MGNIKRAEAYIQAAKRLHENEGEIEIDEVTGNDALESVSHSDPIDGGMYVKAWVWVPEDEVKNE